MSEKCEDCGSNILRADQTPVSEAQRAGLKSLRYRRATHGRFKEAMKAGIAGHAGLRELSTRADDDPSIALLDACATMLDVLAFYQERIANEGYLRTAIERRSIGCLASQIGYQLNRGVAASVPLAFTVEDAPGSPRFAAIDRGTKVQSIPGPGEIPQVFETVEALTARTEFNHLTPKTKETQSIRLDMTKLYLKGTDLQLKPGDLLLIVGSERHNDPLSENWDARIIHTTAIDAAQNQTIVTWLTPLGRRKPGRIVYPAQKHPRVYALRQRAAFFGHNAPDPMILKVDSGLMSGDDWNFSLNQAAGTIDLNAAYPKILKDSWIVLTRPGIIDDLYVEAYRVEKISLTSRKAFAVSSGTTRIVLDTSNNLDEFGCRETVVYAQSEEMEIAETPFRTAETEGSPGIRLGLGMLTPVDGSQITLAGYVPGLQKGQLLIVSGKAARLKCLACGILGLYHRERLPAGSIVRVVGRPIPDAGKLRFLVKTPTHFIDAIEVEFSIVEADLLREALLEYIPADSDDELQSEAATIESVGEADGKTIIYLADTLKNVYDRATVSIYANCVRATHGETKKEVLGSGNATADFQKFILKQTPLTYVSAATPGGSISTLEIRVDGIAWQEVTSLYGQGSRAQVYTTRLADDGKVTVQFGDGMTGARLPSGVENITATYRIGTGQSGLVGQRQLSLLMTRPLGVKTVINPGAPSGANDPETRDEARQNAPSTVQTFDRVVSLADYGNFAGRFAGIGKARASWLWNGQNRFVHLTVAGAGGADIDENSDLFVNLRNAIKACGLPHQRCQIQSYTPLLFSLKANLQVSDGYLKDKVIAAVRAALSNHFSFEKRSFGEPVAASEVIAVMQNVHGVEMVDLDFLRQANQSHTLLVARQTCWDAGTRTLYPAQLLTVDPRGIDLIAYSEKPS